MTSIDTLCPACGRTARIEAARIALVPANETTGWYAFVCTRCERPVIKEAAHATWSVLRLAGASLDGPGEPVVGAHPESPPPGPALTADDLLDFHVLLASEDRLAAPGAGESRRR